MSDIVRGFTPGPWALMSGMPTNVLGGSGIRVARCDFDGDFSHPECAANARLIASAPDMVDEITRLRTALATARNDALEEISRWHDQQADLAMNSLHCGSENGERRAARDAYEFHKHSSKAIRALITKPTIEEKQT